MKRAWAWTAAAAVLIFVITWGVMGVKLLDGDYDIELEAYLGGFCILLMTGCAIYRIISSKCPHCGKILLTNGRFCPCCGKEVRK